MLSDFASLRPRHGQRTQHMTTFPSLLSAGHARDVTISIYGFRAEFLTPLLHCNKPGQGRGGEGRHFAGQFATFGHQNLRNIIQFHHDER